MNAFLAEIYNTAENIGAQPTSADIEKMAEVSLLEDMFKAEKVDVNKLDGETILKLAHTLFGDDSALLKSAESTEEEAKREGEPVAQEKKEKAEGAEEKKEESMEAKVAEADFLGRVMAHSYVDELANLEKSAAFEAVKEQKAQLAAEKLAAAQQAPQAPQSTGSAILDKLAGMNQPASEPAQEPQQQIDVEKLAEVAKAAAAFLKTAQEAGIPFDGEEKSAANPIGVTRTVGKHVGGLLGLGGKKGLGAAGQRAVGRTAMTAGGVGLGAGALGGYAMGKD